MIDQHGFQTTIPYLNLTSKKLIPLNLNLNTLTILHHRYYHIGYHLDWVMEYFNIYCIRLRCYGFIKVVPFVRNLYPTSLLVTRKRLGKKDEFDHFIKCEHVLSSLYYDGLRCNGAHIYQN